MKNFEKFLEIVQSKARKDRANQSGYDGTKYLQGLSDEVEEVDAELRDNNAVYLEDELGDILWDYLCALDHLAHEGKIRSIDHVLNHAIAKYEGRLIAGGVPTEGAWDALKAKQKEQLKKDHEEYLNNL